MSYNESLSSNSNYPPMSQSEWDNAPWNQEDLPEREFDVAVSYSISKDAKVTTNDYDGGEYDEEGYFSPNSLNNPVDAYNTTHKTIEEILEFARHCAEYMLERHDYKVASKFDLRDFVSDCQGWTVDEENVEQN